MSEHRVVSIVQATLDQELVMAIEVVYHLQ